ncbi:chromatin structure-remodeling complex protein BSH isoform X2 [Magnolia sinica]|uniref:chromatin structure-remodeling complex protein BSH isoform X2 n=1 Tax=Magnolia sinica TaxID=86752 RepID=UPI002657E973|nr:chromatin structure-remodeling complex protein BSH isoform X2 [Magnolia sinica]
MKPLPPSAYKQPIKFRIPTAENLVPIRVDVEVDGQHFKDAFTWNPSDPDSEALMFARRTVKDLKLPQAFVTPIAQSIQTQVSEFRSYEGQEMHTGEKLVPIKDLNNFESDPEEFARTFCSDLEIRDPEVGPAIAVAIREQLYEIAIQSVASARETRVSKKGRRGVEHVTVSKSGGTALDLMKLFGSKASVVRKRKEWDVYEPIVDILSPEEVEVLDAREERNARLKKKLDDKDDGYLTRFTRS